MVFPDNKMEACQKKQATGAIKPRGLRLSFSREMGRGEQGHFYPGPFEGFSSVKVLIQALA